MLWHTKSGSKEKTLDCPPFLPSGNTSTTAMFPASLVEITAQPLKVPSGTLHDMLGCPLQNTQIGWVQVSPAGDKKAQIQTHDHQSSSSGLTKLSSICPANRLSTHFQSDCVTSSVIHIHPHGEVISRSKHTLSSTTVTTY